MDTLKMAPTGSATELYSREWLQTNRLGAYAFGSIDRVPRKKYHSLLTVHAGEKEPIHLLSEIEERLILKDREILLNSPQPDQGRDLDNKQNSRFFAEQDPNWKYEFDEVNISRTLKLDPTRNNVWLHYVFTGLKAPLKVTIKPYFTCRSIHALSKQNPFFNGKIDFKNNSSISFHPYSDVPKIFLRIFGAQNDQVRFETRGEWKNRVWYAIEQARGYASEEDVFAPGFFEFEILGNSRISLCIGLDNVDDVGIVPSAETPIKKKNEPKTSLLSKLERAASQFIISRDDNKEEMIVAGYPWFGERIRDTLICLEGFLSGPDRIRRTEKILARINRLPDGELTKNDPNLSELIRLGWGADSPLLYIRAIQQLQKHSNKFSSGFYMQAAAATLDKIKDRTFKYFEISEPAGLYIKRGSWNLTWMNAFWEGRPIIDRNGFAIEVNALFYNAVRFVFDWAEKNHPVFAEKWAGIVEASKNAFLERFWSEEKGYLADTVEMGSKDLSLRPNQLWALALPYSPVSQEMGKSILKAVKSELVTPYGLRSLSPSHEKYRGSCQGNIFERDIAYHQGTVWPWLIGIYADATERIFGFEKMAEEMRPIVNNLLQYLDDKGCLGQIPEIFDGNEPYNSGGASAQAITVAEVLRITKKLV